MVKAKKEKEEIQETITEKDPAVLESALKAVEKKYGKNVVGASNSFKLKDITSIPTSSLALNMKLGRGGFVRGRIVEVYGPQQSGKTSLCFDVVANAQRIARELGTGERALWADAERQYDEDFAKTYGVDTDSLILLKNKDAEGVIDSLETIIRSGMIDVAVVDSVAALTPRAEMDSAIDENHMMLQARLMSAALRRLNPLVAETRTLLMFINQVRSSPSIYTPDAPTGGNALKYFASYRLDVSGGLSQKSRIKEGDAVIGHTMAIKTVKNRLAIPFQECEVDLIYGEGFDTKGEIISIAESLGILDKSGTWYSFNGVNVAQGVTNVKKAFTEDPELYKKVYAEVVAAINGTDEPLI
jgi:recombination protein RecA